MATEGSGKNCARELGQGWKISPSVDIPEKGKLTLAEIEGSGIIQHIWLTCPHEDWRSFILRMYWDGLVLEGIQPTRGILLTAKYNDAIREMAEQMNSLPTPNLPDGTPSEPYRFLLATHQEKELSV